MLSSFIIIIIFIIFILGVSLQWISQYPQEDEVLLLPYSRIICYDVSTIKDGPTAGVQLIHAYGEGTCIGHPDVSNVYRVTDARNTAISGIKGTYCHSLYDTHIVYIL